MSNLKPLRWVMVGADTTPDIKYNGTWITDHGSFDSIGTDGPPYLSTLRGASANASFTYNFVGPAISVMGSNIAQNGSKSYATWACLMDGTPITTVPVSTTDGHNRFLCSMYAMEDGPHSITVKAIVDTNQTFWFDRIEYLPSANHSLTNVATAAWSSDAAPVYDSSWSYKANTCKMTTQHGGTMSFGFYGSSLTWYGVVLPGYTGNSTTATWSIDNNPGQNFTINGYTANDSGFYNLKLFDTPVYPIGAHTLKVTYNGDSTTTPLAMGGMIIQNSSIDGSTVSSSSQGSSITSTSGATVPSSSTLANTTPSSSSSNKVGARIGGAIGGAAILVLAVLLFVFYRRRRRSRNEWNEFEESSAALSETHASAFVLPPRNQNAWRSVIGRGGKARNNLVVLEPEVEDRATNVRDMGLGQGGSTHHDRLDTLGSSESPFVANPPTVIVHLDSGARLSESQIPDRSVIELPPQYTIQ